VGALTLLASGLVYFDTSGPSGGASRSVAERIARYPARGPHGRFLPWLDNASA
jgi:hypothetical protein